MERSWSARFTDGQTAASQPVRVSFDDRGLRIEPRDRTADDLIWPYGALDAEPALGKGATEVLITYRYMPGASVFVQDAAFADALRRRAPKVTTASQRWRWAGPIFAVLCLVIVAYLIAVGLNMRPARAIADLLPDGARASLSAHFTQSLVRKHGRCIAPRGRKSLNGLIDRLLGAAPAVERDVQVTVLNWGLVNAFAAPGGALFLTRGLIQSAKTPEEVAGVLAHEIGHARALHPETHVVRAIGLTAVIDLMLGGGALGNAASVLTLSSYRREDEREADRIGLALMRRAKVSKQGLVDFFAKAAKDRVGADRGVLDFVGTHPAPAERLQTVRNAPDYDAEPVLLPRQWIALRAICSDTTKDPADPGARKDIQ